MDTNKNLFAALLKAQQAMGQLVPDSTNPHLRNRYASLAAVLDVARQPLADNGLVLYQAATLSEGAVIVTSSLVHPASGEVVQEMLPIPLEKMTAQTIGGAITYGRRYLAMAMCGLAPDEDDDGNTASSAVPRQQQAPRPAPQRTPQPAHRPAQNGSAKPTPALPETLDELPELDPDGGAPAEPNPFHDAPANGKQAGNDTPGPADALRINALEIIEAAGLKTPGQAQAWSAQHGYRTNEHSARNAWMTMINDHFGGASLTPPKIREAIVAYIEMCLAEGKKDPVTA